MTIEEGNALIAKFVGIKMKADKKTYELPAEYQQVLKLKTTQFLNFNENLELMFLALKKICSIKDLWCTTNQFQENGCYVCLYYKAQLVEGEWRNARFSCERNKPIDKFKQALWEVISTFCGWYYNHPECQTEIQYELAYVKEEEGRNMIYMQPKEVVCPHCKKIYRESDVKKDSEEEESEE